VKINLNTWKILQGHAKVAIISQDKKEIMLIHGILIGG